MQFSTVALLAGASTLLTPVLAQTWSLCNPMNVTCPPNPALGMARNFVFNSSTTVAQAWNQTAGALSYGGNGAEFTIAKRKDSPTIQSQFYIFWGSFSVVMRAAPGQGVVSSMVLQSDDLDEVDWEFIGGNATSVQSNYYGKGNTTSYDRVQYHNMEDNQNQFHNYTVDWTSERLQWYIDGNLIRTLPYGDANGGLNFPQTPMNVRLGIWAGGDKDNSQGTIEWAGGETDYASPYTMYIQSTYVADYSTGKEYQWTDKSGSWQSIKAVEGNSTVKDTLTKVVVPEKSVADKFSELSSGSKLAIYCGGGGAAALLISAALFFCIRQRRAGRKEREEYNAQVERERELAYRDQMELRHKGLGGWNNQSNVGEDTLGGWSKTPNQDEKAGLMPGQANEVDRSMSRSPASSIVTPAPQWNGGNAGGLISDAGNAYNGGYGNRNVPTSPQGFNFQQEQGWPQQQPQPDVHRGFSQNQGGYQRF
ncbi:glycosyl hydrolase family 16 [Phlyctema vagabunda]|uniref:chitinase n=1 Tax=Phlyctema vagabunda TaxID=108571 RepID=A0ABR4PI52_9HELO